jgi:uncharacterized protein (DUF924 family)
MSAVAVRPLDVLAFWLQAGPERWFTPDAAFDAEIRARFLPAYEAAMSGGLNTWQDNAEGALALLLLLDQFPRNMFRGTPRAYAGDALARAIAGRAIERGFDRNYQVPLRRFFYLPFMHSEDLGDQERCVSLCRAAGDAEGLKYAEHHADIIRRFGRFPHRNAILGRSSSAAELQFLQHED